MGVMALLRGRGGRNGDLRCIDIFLVSAEKYRYFSYFSLKTCCVYLLEVQHVFMEK